MKKSANLQTGLAVICWIITFGLATPSLAQACSGSWQTAHLRVGEHSLDLKHQVGYNKRCVEALPASASGPWVGQFDIRVTSVGGFTGLVLGDIQACSKATSPLPSSECPGPDASDPVTFEVVATKSTPDRITVEVRVNDASSADNQEYDIHVPGVGTLDPTVQIIRTTSRLLYLEAAEQLLQESFDEIVLNDEAFDSLRDELRDLQKSAD